MQGRMPRSRKPRRPAARHAAEPLESRVLLATFTVTNTENSGEGSLREAILDANAAPGADAIQFNIPGPGPHVIRPTFTVPGVFDSVPMPITGPVVIDGYTQPTARPNTLARGNDAQIRVQLDGALGYAGLAGLFISGSGVTVRGLSITGFTDGIIIRGDPINPGGGNTIAGNFIGVTPGGAAAGNRDNGVSVEGSPVNTIGGTSPADRNVISNNGYTQNASGIGVRLTRANTVDTYVQGNYIGTDPSGTRDMGNSGPGVLVGVFAFADGYASRTTIGGAAPGAGNLISGNNGNGIVLLGAPARDNVIQGNFIGTDVTGAMPLPNELNGVLFTFPGSGVAASSNNLVGGDDPGTANVISGNKRAGVFLVGPAQNNVVRGNFIGTNAFGNTDVGNLQEGVLLADVAQQLVNGPSNNQISANVISANRGDGVEVRGVLTGRNVFQRNRIGLAASGSPLGNGGHGVFINGPSNQLVGYDGATGDVPSSANVIARNAMDGVAIVTGSRNRVGGNAIYANGTGGIDLGDDGPTANDEGDADTGANTLLNAPQVDEVTLRTEPAGARVTGEYHGAPNAAVRVEFYRNPGTDGLGIDGGKEYLGFRDYTAGPDGHVPFLADFTGNQFALGDVVTAIAIDADGNTSEFGSGHCDVDLAPLEVSGANFAMDAGTGMCTATGTIELGHAGGGPKLRIEGTARYSTRVFEANGAFSGLFGGAWHPLFNGSITVDVGTNTARLLVPALSRLPADLHPAALPVSFTGITFLPADVRLTGAFDLPQGLGGFKVEVKSSDYFVIAPDGLLLSGLSIALPKQQGKLFGWLKVEITGLGASYNAATDTLKLQGAFKLKDLFGPVDVEANFAGENYIQVGSEGYSVRGTLSVSDIKVADGVFGLQEMSLTVALANGELNELAGSAKVKLPSGKTVEGSIGFKRVEGSLQLDSLGLTGDDLDVPLGTTGVMLQKVGVAVKDLAVGEPPATFGGTLGFSYGPEFDIELPRVFGGTKFDDVSLLGLELSVAGLPLNIFNFDVGSLVITAEGTLKILGGVATGTASAELNFPAGVLKLAATFTALGGFITANGSISADTSLNLTATAAASIQVPAGIPVIGGTSLAGGSAYAQYRHNNTLADDYIAGYAEMRWFGLTFRIGQRLNFDGTSELLGASPLPAPAASLLQAVGGEFAVPPGTEYILLSAAWQNAAASAVPFRVTAPNGTTYSNADSGNGVIETVPALSGPRRLTVAVRTPAAGVWRLELPDTTGLGEVTVEGARTLPAPTIAVTSPASTVTDTRVGVTYAAAAPNGGAAVALFYDTDAAGFDGVPIATGLDPAASQFTWDTAAVPPGDYRVYGVVTDAGGAPAFAYAPGLVRVRHVAGRYVFYNNSSFDGRDPAATSADDAAIATDKRALLPGQAPGFEHWTTYPRGINGVIVDLVLPQGVALTASDFTLRSGAGGDPRTWALLPAAPAVSVRRGAGSSGTDRVTLLLPDGVVRNAWLQVTVGANERTGLPQPDVFYFGNLVGATGAGAGTAPGRPPRVTALDVLAVRRALSTAAAVDSRYDINRDGRINALDVAAVRRGLNRGLAPVTLPIPAAFATATMPPRDPTERDLLS